MSFSGYEIEAPCHVPTPILAGGVEELSEYPTTPVEEDRRHKRHVCCLQAEAPKIRCFSEALLGEGFFNS